MAEVNPGHSIQDNLEGIGNLLKVLLMRTHTIEKKVTNIESMLFSINKEPRGRSLLTAFVLLGSL
jgi:hypothetical protein